MNRNKGVLMNTRFEKSVRSSDEWYTPKEVLKALGRFDLDPCAPVHPLWPTAEVMYDRDMDGLSLKWEGRVWLNPPYSRPPYRTVCPKVGGTRQRHRAVVQPLRFQNVSGRHFRESDGHEIPAPPHPVLPPGRNTRRFSRLRQHPDRIRSGKRRSAEKLQH